jgi:hypothetical protein
MPEIIGRYRWTTMRTPGHGMVSAYMCEDCGAWVGGVAAISDGREAHDRFHAILNDHAKAIAVLVNAHLSERTHARYDVRERVGDNPNNWFAEALAEVVADTEDS